jgi:hypothetical protein
MHDMSFSSEDLDCRLQAFGLGLYVGLHARHVLQHRLPPGTFVCMFCGIGNLCRGNGRHVTGMAARAELGSRTIAL